MTDTIADRVVRGVALLDRTLADWDQRIDLDKLDLCSSCNCILGQEFTGHPDVLLGDDPYNIGLHELFPNAGDIDRIASWYGFDVRGAEDYAALTAEWRRVILARRGGEASC